MLDNQIIALVVQILIAGEATAGIAGTPIAAAFQPSRQGVNTPPTAFIFKIADHRYGYIQRSDKWDANNQQMVHTETQQYETTFQISALATQNPATPTQLTASDICNLCAAILQSDAAIATFEAQGVGIERVTDVRNPYFLDDRNQFEANPSFDFVLTHKQIITSTTPIVQSTEIEIYSVGNIGSSQATNWDSGGNWDSGSNWDN